MPYENGKRIDTVGFRLLERDAKQRDEQEEKRLLYVAMTRAQEYLIVSGSDAPHKQSYLQELLDARAQLDSPLAERIVLTGPQTTFDEVENAQAEFAGVSQAEILADDGLPAALPPLVAPLPAPTITAIGSWTPTGLESLVSRRVEFEQQVLEGAPERIIPVRRGTKSPQAPAYIVGEMAHHALQAWRFPHNTPDLDTILEQYAIERGLSTVQEIEDAVRQAHGVLARFAQSEFFQEMRNVPLRQHEVPFVVQWQGRMLHGALDALYQTAEGQWRVVDFKTDRLRGVEPRAYTLDHYAVQMALYLEAIKMLTEVQCDVCVYFIRESQSVILTGQDLAAAAKMASDQLTTEFGTGLR